VRGPAQLLLPSKTPQSSVLGSLTPAKIFFVAFVAVLITATWLLLKWTRGFLDGLEKHNPRLRFFLRQVEPPVRIAIWFIAILVVAEILAPSQDAFLAALGSAALAIGLGLQDLIKNLIGGLVVVVDRPFQIGDRIKMGEAYGEVKQIGLRSTKVQMNNGMLVTIPNSEVLTKLIFNANSGVAESVVSAELTLPKDADADHAMSICHEVAVCCPYTHLGRDIKVKLHEDSKLSSMIVTIQAYVYDHRFEAAMKTELLRRARHEFMVHGIGSGHSAEPPG
jgi:small-conductance mechanosensitive channel